MENTLQKLVEMVQQASPFVWAAARQAVRADIFAEALGLGGSMGLYLTGLHLFKWTKSQDEFDLLPLGPIMMILAVIAAGVFLVNLGYCLIAPDYVAIQKLIGLVK